MTFHVRRALAVFWKDSLDLWQNKALLASMGALPLGLVVVPSLIVWAYLHSVDATTLRLMARYYDPSLALGSDAAGFLIDRVLTDWFGLYLVMPVFVPILISSQSIAGEKERRTLEPLLASPLTAQELVAGKSIASLLPAVVISIVAYGVLCVVVDVIAYPVLHRLLLPNTLWTVGVLVIAPLFAFFGNGVAVLVSARVGEARLAQQLSALVVLPLMGIVGGQMAGVLRSGPAAYALETAVILVLDVVLVVLSVRLFDRERLLSRWT